MRKIGGLRFLLKFFPTVTVPCVFLQETKPEFDENLSVLEEMTNCVFRVRTGSKTRSEMNLPQKTCATVDEVRSFVSAKSTDLNGLQFVIHPVERWYFDPVYIGSLALFDPTAPNMLIEFQSVNAVQVANLDKGLRPRDWPVCASFRYPNLQRMPSQHRSDDTFDSEGTKRPLEHLWRIGRKIDALRFRIDGKMIESVTRFNIYRDGSVLLDDHRDVASFR